MAEPWSADAALTPGASAGVRGAMFDYVIVGAGSAGCALAARLGEDRGVRVAVIEAGPPDSEPLLHMPLPFRPLWDSRFDWGLTEHQRRRHADIDTDLHPFGGDPIPPREPSIIRAWSAEGGSSGALLCCRLRWRGGRRVGGGADRGVL
jgi:choline dehydrogenase-like flavoprotein